MKRKGSLKPVAAGLSMGAFFIAAVSLALQASSELGLSNAETSSWIFVAWGLPSLLTIALTIRYRQPLVVTGNIFILIFVLLLGGELSWAELVGATMTAGFVVLILGLTGVTHRVASLLPPSIVYGVLAGAVLGLLADAITALGTATLLVGSIFAAYFLSRALWRDQAPALLVAMLVGIVVALASSAVGAAPGLAWPQLTFTPPEFNLRAIATATPVLVIFIALQANAPSIVFLRSEGYHPPERVTALVSGSGTVLGSMFGPMGVSLSLPAAAIVAGPDAGEFDVRRWAALIAAAIGLLVAMTSGFATDLLAFIPGELLVAVVGLAVIGILAQALREITSGPLTLGPLVAFAVTASNIELLGLGRFFWAIVFGLALSLLLERDKLAEMWKTSREGHVVVQSPE